MPIEMPYGQGKVREATTLHEELQSTKECGEQKKQSSSGKSTPMGNPIPKGSSENIRTSKIIQANRIYIYSNYEITTNENMGHEF